MTVDVKTAGLLAEFKAVSLDSQYEFVARARGDAMSTGDERDILFARRPDLDGTISVTMDVIVDSGPPVGGWGRDAPRPMFRVQAFPQPW